MNQKLLAFLAIVSFSANYIMQGGLNTNDDKPQIIVKDDLTYLNSFREYLESQIEDDNNIPKPFYEYSIKDIAYMFTPNQKHPKGLPLSTLLQKVFQIKLKKLEESFSYSEDYDSALTGVAFGMITFQIMYAM